MPAPTLRLNQWTLAGQWEVGDEAAQARRAGGRIAYRFKARDLHLVLGPGDEIEFLDPGAHAYAFTFG